MSLLLRTYALRRRLHHLPPLLSSPHHSSQAIFTSEKASSPVHERPHFTIHFCFRSIAVWTTNVADSAVLLDRRNFRLRSSFKEDGITKQLSALKAVRSMSSNAKVAPNQLRQASLRVTLLSPGFVYEPYKPREPIPFWKRCFTLSGWRRTKEDVILEMKNAYAIARLRKVSGYTKKLFYKEAVKLYKEINLLLANGDKASLRKAVTENMFSNFKNEIKRRESVWSSVYWELVEPVVSIRTLRARLIAIDRNDLDKAFIQLTLEFLAKQKFEAYNADGAVVSGDKSKEVLVRDIWVFEKSLFHPGSYWRLCARLSP